MDEVLDGTLRQRVFIAAIAECGYPGATPKPGSGTAILYPGEPPTCRLAYKASVLARLAGGHESLSFEDWHALQPYCWTGGCSHG